MSNKPRNRIQTYSEMVQANEERAASRMFSKDVDSAEKISALVSMARQELKDMPDKISLGDTDCVKSITEQYLKSCDEVGVLPSKLGLCRAYGCSRQAVTDYMNHNPRHPTSEYLAIVFDAFNELLSNAALAGSVHPVYAIFLGKAVYGLRDTQTVEVVQPQTGPLFTETNPIDIANKYNALPED